MFCLLFCLSTTCAKFNFSGNVNSILCGTQSLLEKDRLLENASAISWIPLRGIFVCLFVLRKQMKPCIPRANGEMFNFLPSVGAVFSQGTTVSFRKLLFQCSHYSIALEG